MADPAAAMGALPAFRTSYGVERPGGFRFVFFTHIHLRRDLGSPEAMAKALQAVMALDPKPAAVDHGKLLLA
jgi:hypothetical protein